MRVVITQRVDIVEAYSERRDALDQAWPDALARLLGRPILMLPLPNSSADPAALAPQLIVLSGGNDLGAAPERDATEAAVLDYASEARIPVLAVCRGMQMIQHHCGGGLRRLDGHVAASHDVKAVTPEVGPEILTVNSFHGAGIAAAALASDLEPLYLHADGTVEAACHREYPWLAVMWHPERNAPNGDANIWLAARLRGIT